MRTDLYACLVAEYVAAQLSVQFTLPFWHLQISRQKLACHLRPRLPANPLPVRLSNGQILTGVSSLQDLFDAVDWAAVKGDVSNQEQLLNLLTSLNSCTKD